MTSSTRKTRQKPNPAKEKPEEFPCGFCNRVFRREASFVSHMCKQRRRYLQRDDKPVKIGFMAFQKVQQSLRCKSDYNSFVKSQFYGAFVRFGKHVMELEAISPQMFVDFLLSKEIPIDNWTHPVVYSTYIRELNRDETPLQAIERNFMLMEQWGNDTGKDWRDFFREIEPPLALLWITTGRISPWMLFIASSASELIARLSPEQVASVEATTDPGFWHHKIARYEDEVVRLAAMLQENGI